MALTSREHNNNNPPFRPSSPAFVRNHSLLDRSLMLARLVSSRLIAFISCYFFMRVVFNAFLLCAVTTLLFSFDSYMIPASPFAQPAYFTILTGKEK